MGFLDHKNILVFKHFDSLYSWFSFNFAYSSHNYLAVFFFLPIYMFLVCVQFVRTNTLQASYITIAVLSSVWMQFTQV